MTTFKDFYRKSMGLKKPTQTYAFYREDSNKPITQNGVVITRNGYSPKQAIRFLKLAIPSLSNVDLIAKLYTPKTSPVPVIKQQTPQPPKNPTPQQLELNI